MEQSSQPYSVMRERTNFEFKMPNALIVSPKSRKTKDPGYSADGSISSLADSPVKVAPEEPIHYDKLASIISNKSRRQTMHTLSGDFSYLSDDNVDLEAGEISTMSMDNHKKFVNGLPTVVNRRTTPSKFYCLKCNHQGTTVVKEKLGRGAWMLSTLFFLTLFWPCLAVVCCSRSCKDFVHECPNCGNVVGKKKFMT